MDQALRDGYNKNHMGGMAKLDAGEFDCWSGIPDKDFHKPFVAAVINVNERLADLVGRVAESAQKNQVGIYLGGRDFPVHVTLSQGKVDGASFGKVSTCADGLVGVRWSFEHFVLGGRDCIIGSEDGPAEVASVRADINKVMNEPGRELQAGSPEILHATIYRIVSYPTKDALMAFVRDMLAIRAEVADKPLNPSVVSVYWGPVGRFLRREVALV